MGDSARGDDAVGPLARCSRSCAQRTRPEQRTALKSNRIRHTLCVSIVGAITGAGVMLWVLAMWPSWLIAETSSTSRKLEGAGIPRTLLKAAIEAGTVHVLKGMVVAYSLACDADPSGNFTRTVNCPEIYVINKSLFADEPDDDADDDDHLWPLGAIGARAKSAIGACEGARPTGAVAIQAVRPSVGTGCDYTARKAIRTVVSLGRSAFPVGRETARTHTFPR